jgi:hypothetical protein
VAFKPLPPSTPGFPPLPFSVRRLSDYVVQRTFPLGVKFAFASADGLALLLASPPVLVSLGILESLALPRTLLLSHSKARPASQRRKAEFDARASGARVLGFVTLDGQRLLAATLQYPVLGCQGGCKQSTPLHQTRRHLQPTPRGGSGPRTPGAVRENWRVEE